MIPVVDTEDNVVGYKKRSSIDDADDIVRSASLWITNSKGEILLAQRSLLKKNNPGKWGEAVGGTVEGYESYEQTMVREAQEELGIRVEDYRLGPKQYIDSPSRYFVQWYEAGINKPSNEFIIQKDELEQVAWISKKQLRTELQDCPGKYIDEMKEIAALFLHE